MIAKLKIFGAAVLAGGMSFAIGPLVAQTSEGATVDVSIFPHAKPGYKQHIMQPPPQADETMYLIEIVAGQMMLSDCNSIRISGDIEEEDLDGWGYPYFEIDDIGPPVQTMMACPESEKTEGFVPVYFGDDALARYNSKLPLVVYAPEGLTIGYRIWATDGTLHQN